MYFSQYKANKRSCKKRNRVKNNKSLFAGILKFVKLAAVITAIVPAIYLADTVYGLIDRAVDLERYLEVRSIRIKGNNFVHADELTQILQKIKGHNILKVNIKEIAERIKKHPWIKDVSVRRELPDTIFIDVSERTPAVYLNNKGKLYLTDEEGVIIDNKRESLLALPVVYGINLSGMAVGKKIPVEGLRSAIEVKKEIASIPWIDLSSAGIEVEERKQIVLHLKGFRIRLGHDGYKEKLERFYEITKNLQDKGVPYKEVDLRFENQIIVKTAGI